IRSHGLSTPRLTAESKQPPPDTSRYAKPALSRISARRSCSAAGTLPARGSCPSRRIVVSARDGIARPYRRRPGDSGARDVATLAGVDLQPVADIHEERDVDDRSRLELCRLRHVRDRVALDPGLGLDDLELDG